ncbi:(E)-4-hydroxy-3-methylbut-2-enyl-diphosphate synthase [Rariglobus hedericola]|uniref:4-hydroxy-3-methylbut-2-en-1-yl diphosphate synthase (flavodoxin) n=1 Tax=Rariglobus hedericola TaxID=2597822 RepID=A0A556QRA6_9BACT|nr:(E)-4-hydroxy-3-methylbut-2-enyl-diphosphate synthase [Rariglobus hedericola]TSJ79174.1 (E)-4-hydroxy-3-methylbut-2-enyl-diphosphate synthase [Rariglobus hedericola]
MSYCASRFHTVRRLTHEVMVGQVGVGGVNPVRVQSMTTSDTQDIAATVKQSIALAEVGCEIIRITAPNVPAAKCLKDIREQFSAAGFGHIPLVADIHFLPSAAMEAVEHVEKVRVNPGNYADKKKFAVKEYSDSDYDLELQRLHESFSPLVLRAKTLGRSLRIGTNHGSLSDRIMNRYGDTPLGMVESALEFLRIGESHGFKQMILSMKSSNPKVMIEAYRLLVEHMNRAGMNYPLHLGVTEAGDGEDGRIKSAIGIGSLLYDGLGDTIRVSLTEDSVYEVPVAQALVKKAMSLWQPPSTLTASPFARFTATADAIDPFHFSRRPVQSLPLSATAPVGPEQPPRVIVRAASIDALPETLTQLASPRLADTPAEGVLIAIDSASDLQAVARILAAATQPPIAVLELSASLAPAAVAAASEDFKSPAIFLRSFGEDDVEPLLSFVEFTRARGHTLAIATTACALASLAPALPALGDDRLIFTLSNPAASLGNAHPHPTGAYRALVEQLRLAGSRAPLWIRNTAATTVHGDPSFLSRLLDAAILTGSLLCDGLGDLVSIETEADAPRATKVAYNVLQGAGARISKTEFVACPSCGRTLFDLQTTTQRIRAQTGHLKGVKLAIMGCIVNGPGEMADADFGYVGGAPGKINLYVGKTCVQYNIPQVEADARLISLIKEHGKWFDPAPVTAP